MADGACVGTGQGPIHAIIGMAGNTFQVPWLNDGTEHYFQPSFTMFRTTEWYHPLQRCLIIIFFWGGEGGKGGRAKGVGVEGAVDFPRM